MSSCPPPFKPIAITGRVHHYPWGVPARDSLVAHLGKVPFELTKGGDLPCAELWFGDHKKAPAQCVGYPTLNLRDIISANPTAVLGKHLTASEEGTRELPFLFKVLSVRHALSIQAHPSRSLARVLHAADPQNYPDTNHKPEFGVALSRVELLYGLRPYQEIKDTFSVLGASVPDISTILAAADSKTEPERLKRLLGGIYSLEPHDVSSCVEILIATLSAMSPLKLDKSQQLFLLLKDQFPRHDVGLLVSLMLNVVKLEPGEGLFVEENVPHAYLSGDLMECMANSDNVVRAGLTEKHQDATTLLSMLDYETQTPQILHASEANSSAVQNKGECPGVRWYPRRAVEFQLGLISGHAQLYSAGPMLLVCLGGEVSVTHESEILRLSDGVGLLIPANIELQVDAESTARLAVVRVMD